MATPPRRRRSIKVTQMGERTVVRGGEAVIGAEHVSEDAAWEAFFRARDAVARLPVTLLRNDVPVCQVFHPKKGDTQ